MEEPGLGEEDAGRPADRHDCHGYKGRHVGRLWQNGRERYGKKRKE